MISLVTLLAAVAGPSSAIAVVPRLGWWESQVSMVDGITTYIARTFELWPENLTANTFNSENCVSSRQAASENCPSAGWATIAAYDINNNIFRPFNITMPITNSNMNRFLAATSDATNGAWTRERHNGKDFIIYRSGYSLASSVSELFARNLACMYESADNNLPLSMSHGRSIFAVSKPNVGQIFKPFVSVQCRAFAISERENMWFPHNDLIIPPMDKVLEHHWKVPERVWRSLIDSENSISSSWVDFSADTGKPSVGLVVFFRNGMSGTRETDCQLVPCTADARWVPVNIWIDPKVDNAIHEDQNNLLEATYGGDPHPYPLGVSNARRISFHQSYIDALTIDVTTPNKSAIESILEEHLASLDRIAYLDTIASLTSLYIADVLARVQSPVEGFNFYHTQLRSHICGARSPSPRINFTASEWTKYGYSSSRYGYGWGLKGYPIKIASTILLLNVVFCLVHIASLLHGGWTSSVL